MPLLPPSQPVRESVEVPSSHVSVIALAVRSLGSVLLDRRKKWITGPHTFCAGFALSRRTITSPVPGLSPDFSDNGTSFPFRGHESGADRFKRLARSPSPNAEVREAPKPSTKGTGMSAQAKAGP